MHRFQIGLARLDGAADTAEQVDLVADIEPSVVSLAVRQRGIKALCGARLTAIAGAIRYCRIDRASRTGFAQRASGSGEVGGGHAQVGIGFQRLRDKPVEPRIVVKPPPIARRRLRRKGGLRGGMERRLRFCFRQGRLIVRPDSRAGGQRGGGGQEGEQTFHAVAPSTSDGRALAARRAFILR